MLTVHLTELSAAAAKQLTHPSDGWHGYVISLVCVCDLDNAWFATDNETARRLPSHNCF